ncbi:MAG TPA: hypothetical protein DHW02_02915, partial [Ktedonobacter sp.]|nr:hypothetical protein [Ktedonobacter sp.]
MYPSTTLSNNQTQEYSQTENLIEKPPENSSFPKNLLQQNTLYSPINTLFPFQYGTQGVVQSNSGSLDLFTIGIMALTMHQQQHQWDVNELEQKVKDVLEEVHPEAQIQQRMPRSGILGFIARMPVALYSFAKVSGQPAASLVAEEVLPLYAAGIPACWRLYYESGQAELERIIPGYLSHLSVLAHVPSTLQKNAAALLSQTHQLTALLEQGHENFGRAIEHCKQAILYGQLAEDLNLQAMALIRLQDTYYENRRFAQSFQVLRQAESFSKEVSPLLQGRIYARLASAYAHQSQPELALRCNDVAQNIFPSNPGNDVSFLYNHTDRFILYANQAAMYRQLGQPKSAWDAITKAGEFVSNPANPRRIDFLQYQIQATIALNSLEQSCILFEALISLIAQFGRELDMVNTYNIY